MIYRYLSGNSVIIHPGKEEFSALVEKVSASQIKPDWSKNL